MRGVGSSAGQQCAYRQYLVDSKQGVEGRGAKIGETKFH